MTKNHGEKKKQKNNTNFGGKRNKSYITFDDPGFRLCLAPVAVLQTQRFAHSLGKKSTYKIIYLFYYYYFYFFYTLTHTYIYVYSIPCLLLLSADLAFKKLAAYMLWTVVFKMRVYILADFSQLFHAPCKKIHRSKKKNSSIFKTFFFPQMKIWSFKNCIVLEQNIFEFTGNCPYKWVTCINTRIVYPFRKKRFLKFFFLKIDKKLKLYLILERKFFKFTWNRSYRQVTCILICIKYIGKKDFYLLFC